MTSTDRQAYGTTLLAVQPSGQSLWQRYNPFEYTFRNTPALSNNGEALYVLSNATVLQALDAHTGAFQWTVSCMGDICSHSSPAVAADGSIYASSDQTGVACGRDYLHKVNPDGSKAWQINQDRGVRSQAVSPDGTVYVSTRHAYPGAVEPGHISAVSPQGKVIWDSPGASGFWGVPTVGDDGSIYTSAEGNVVALSPADGSERWRTPVPGCSNPALGHDGSIYVTSSAGTLLALDPLSGAEKWSASTSHYRGTPTVGGDGTVYTIAQGGYVAAVSPTGTELWKTVDSVGATQPIIGPEGNLYVAGGKTLCALNGGPPEAPKIGVMLGGAVSGKLFTDDVYREKYTKLVLEPALSRIGRDAPGTYIKFFVPWGDPENVGGGLDNGWAYDHRDSYSATLSADKKQMEFTNRITGEPLSDNDVEGLISEYCRGADRESLRWIMQEIEQHELKAYPILGDGGRAPKVGTEQWLVPDDPEAYCAQLYVHARAVARMFMNGEMPGGPDVDLWQVENEINYAGAAAAYGWRKPSALWANPEMQEAIVATLRNAIKDEQQFWADKGRALPEPQVAVDLHAGYEGYELGGIPFDEAAGWVAPYGDLIAMNDYAFVAPSGIVPPRVPVEAASTRLGELADRLSSRQ